MIKQERIDDFLNIYGRQITYYIKHKQYGQIEYMIEDLAHYIEDEHEILGRALLIGTWASMEGVQEAYDTVLWIQRKVQEEDIVSYEDEDCGGSCDCV